MIIPVQQLHSNPFLNCLDRQVWGAYHEIKTGHLDQALIEIDSLQEILGITFREVSHLRQAFVHRSYLNETHSFSVESNERLEFLGDALLDFVVAERLYSDFPSSPEGDLTKLRSSLVRTETLARIASSMKLGDYLYLGKGEDGSGGRLRQRNLASVLEAVIGAVLVDRGFDVAREFILTIISDELKLVTSKKPKKDPKSKLQEAIQAEQRLTPTYQTVDSMGPDHDKVFIVEVFTGETLLGQGSGKNKRAAEQEAAKSALKKLKGEEDLA